MLEVQTKLIAELQKNSQPVSLADLAQNIQASDRIETAYQILRHLEANDRGVVLSGNPGEPSSLKVSWQSK